jgi:hypothetical protein
MGFTLTTLDFLEVKGSGKHKLQILKRLEGSECFTQDIVGRKREMSCRRKDKALLAAQRRRGENETKGKASRPQVRGISEAELSASVASCDEREVALILVCPWYFLLYGKRGRGAWV